MRKVYLILKGKHRAVVRFRPFLGFRNNIRIRVAFHYSCLERVKGIDSLDANKLYGVSFGRHHRNSIRIGWRSTGNQIELCAYHYNRGVRTINWLEPTIDVSKEYYITVLLKKDIYEILLTDRKASFYNNTYMKYKFPFFRIGYYLYPYFGGNRTAPINMRIIMKHE